jgi:hypothetical protein
MLNVSRVPARWLWLKSCGTYAITVRMENFALISSRLGLWCCIYAVIAKMATVFAPSALRITVRCHVLVSMHLLVMLPLVIWASGHTHTTDTHARTQTDIRTHARALAQTPTSVYLRTRRWTEAPHPPCRRTL